MKYHLIFIGLFQLGTISFTQTMFTDITSLAGINHQFEVYEGMFGGGVCVLDVNNDGWEDLYLTGGMKDDILYLNQKNGTFRNILEEAGLSLTKKFVTQGVVSADVDRNGWVDLYITTINTKDSLQPIPRAIKLLFLNNGNGSFTDATAAFRLDKMVSFSTGANFGDINCDGYPDLYVGNYFHNFEGQLSTINDATIVNANRTAFGYLLINKKGKYFSNDYHAWGLSHKGFGFGGVFTDYDNDGDQDLFVNQDFGYKAIPDFLFRNEYPKKKFEDVSVQTGMDLKINSMGTAVGDYDNDGDMDYYVTNIRSNYFMVNQGPDQAFVNKTFDLGMQYFAISWGTNFADFDQDGDVDLFVANGDLNPNCTPMADFYFKNEGGKFSENARAVGLNDYGIGRGSAVLDFDNDGDQDVLVVNQKPVLSYPVSSVTRLYRNDSTLGNWIKIKLIGYKSESRGLGSRIEVYTQGKKQIREVDGGGSSHISQNSSIVHFGLNQAVSIDSIWVKWSGQEGQIIKNLPANQLLIIEEPMSKKRSKWPVYSIIGASLIFLFWWIRSKRGEK